MSIYGEARAWLRAVMMRRKAEREMHDEMTAHIEQAMERFVARGMSERDALRAARLEFGNVALIQEQARDSRGGRWVDNLMTDVRYAFRYFARTPLVSITIVLTLSLGVGITSAGFTLLKTTQFQPPPGIAENESLVVIRGLQKYRAALIERLLPLREVEAYAASSVFEKVSAWRTFNGIANFGSDGSSVDRVRVSYVLPDFLTILAVPLAAGSGLYAPDTSNPDRPDLTAVIHHALAVKRFGTASQAIGQSIRINDVLVTVVGVTAPRFEGYRSSGEVYLPHSAMRVVESARTPDELSEDSLNYRVVGRLRAGTSVASALPVVRSIGAQFKRAPDLRTPLADAGADVVALVGDTRVMSDKAQSELILSSIALATLNLLILLVCTTTVSSLLVASAVTRSREVGVRLALGAGRTRIVRQLLTESAILSLAGGALGLVFMAVLCRVFEVQLREFDLRPSVSTAAFTSIFAIVTALLCGMSPALHATRQSLSSVLKNGQSGATSRSRLQSTFVVAQIAVAQPVLVVLAMFTVLVVREIRRETEHALNDNNIIAEFDENSSAQIATAAAELKALSDRIAGLPGVTKVIPWSGDNGARTSVELWSAPRTDIAANARTLEFEFKLVAPEYFEAMELPLLAGRKFELSDRSAQIVPLIVSSDFASRSVGNSQLLGTRFCFISCSGRDSGEAMYEIVGVVSAAALGNADDGRAIKVFRPYFTSNAHSWLIKSDRASAATIAAIYSAARQAAPHIPIERIATIAERNKDARDIMLAISGGAASGGLITLLLGCIGLYAVVALAVNQRRREIGIRIAMGARQSQVVSHFFKGGLRLSVIGLAIGLPLSAASIRLLGNQVGLPQTNTVGIALFIAGVVVLVACFATWLPARRAATVDPLEALRAD